MGRTKPGAYEQALKLAGARDRTRAELARALATRGHPDAEVEAALERLAALGYLDDARTAAARAARGLAEGRARAEVERRLLQAGVAEAVALRAVRDAAEAAGHDDEAAARALVARRRLGGAKAARFLLGRGFSEDVVRRVVPGLGGAE